MVAGAGQPEGDKDVHLPTEAQGPKSKDLYMEQGILWQHLLGQEEAHSGHKYHLPERDGLWMGLGDERKGEGPSCPARS